jgi:hypothetical protein
MKLEFFELSADERRLYSEQAVLAIESRIYLLAPTPMSTATSTATTAMATASTRTIR